MGLSEFQAAGPHHRYSSAPNRSSHAQKVTTYWAKSFDFRGLKRFAGRKNSPVTIRNPEDSKMLDLKIMRVITQQLVSKDNLEDSAIRDFHLFYHAGTGDEGLEAAALTPEGLDNIHPLALNATGSSTWSISAGSTAGFAPNA